MDKKPEIRKLLDISTAHVPADLRTLAAEHEDTSQWNTVVYVLDVGFLLWVPDDPKAHAATMEEPPHPAILAIQVYARELGCDYVLIDRDAPDVDGLPVFDEDDEVLPPCAQMMKCYCAGHANGLVASAPCDTRELAR